MATVEDLIAVGYPPRWAGIAGADWQDWSPSYGASGSLTWTSVSTSQARYIEVGKLIIFLIDATGTLGGSASTDLTFSLPVTAASSTGNPAIGGGYVGSPSAVCGFCYLNASVVTGSCRRYDSSNYATSGNGTISIIGAYEAA